MDNKKNKLNELNEGYQPIVRGKSSIEEYGYKPIKTSTSTNSGPVKVPKGGFGSNGK